MSEDPKKELHPLENTWILWYHNGKDNWTMDSYQKIYEFSTVEDFWRLYNNIPSVVNNMFFLMKKGHPPIWEVPQNIDGGSWSYKFAKKKADSFWLKFSLYMIGETIMTQPTEDIIGLSVSPKVWNVTIRIWNCNSIKCQNMEFNQEYTELISGQPLYKEFNKPNEILKQVEMTDEFREKIKTNSQNRKKNFNRRRNNNKNDNQNDNRQKNYHKRKHEKAQEAIVEPHMSK